MAERQDSSITYNYDEDGRLTGYVAENISPTALEWLDRAIASNIYTTDIAIQSTAEAFKALERHVDTSVSASRQTITRATNNAVSDIESTVKTVTDRELEFEQQVIDSTSDLIGKVDSVVQSTSDTFVGYLEDQYTTFDTLVDTTTGDIADFIINGIAAVDSAQDLFEEDIKAKASSVDGLITNINNNVNSTLTTLTGDVTAKVNNVTNNALSGTRDIINDISSFVSQGFGDVTGGVETAVVNVDTAITDMVNSVSTAISDKVVSIEDSYTTLSDIFLGGVTSQINSSTDLYNGLSGLLTEQLASNINSATRVSDSIEKNTTSFIDNIVDGIGTTVKDLTSVSALLPSSITSLGESIFTSGKENVADPITLLSTNLPEAIADIIKATTSDESNDFTGSLKQLAKGDGNVQGMISDYLDRIFPDTGINPTIRTLMFAVATPLILTSMLSGVSNVHAQQIMHEYSFSNPSQLLSPADLVDALRKGNIDNNKFTDDLKRLGHYSDDIQILEKLGRTLIDPTTSIDMWLREIFTDEQLTESLKGAGYNPTDIEALKKHSQYIPNINDLILMAVRDVFSPGTVQEFGLLDDFPPQLMEHAGRVGLTREVAEFFWGAHWGLPSPQMGFEMFHRDIISEEQLKVLMKALDIAPGWREHIIALSYSPLTRVDVRRMHKLGVLNDDGVVRAYLDLGYSPEDAEKLKDFTVEYNTDAPADDEQELTLLTRSTVMNMYKDKILNREEATEHLRLLNYSDNAVELYLFNADTDEQLKERKQQTQIIIDKYKNNALSFNEAEDAIYRIGLSTPETEIALNKIVGVAESRITIPSKEDLAKFVKKGIIKDDEYIANMQAHGFSNVWAKRYLKLIKG